MNSLPKATGAPSKPMRQYPYSEKPAVTCTSFGHYENSQYQPLEKKSKTRALLRERLVALLVTFAIAVVLAVAIPLSIILPQKLIKPLPINVLIPFYIDPASQPWAPLYEAIVKHGDTNFSIIVNPDNGPGSSAWPKGEYIAGIKALNKYPNVRTLGYIDTAGGSRENTTVRKEIATYAGWSNTSTEMALSGIYFDHTPYADENDAAAYLVNISATVRQSSGFGSNAMVVHNPGRLPAVRLMASKPDLTVIFEGTYDYMPRKTELSANPIGSPQKRENVGMLVHSVPKDLGKPGLRKMIDDVRKDVEWLYITDLSEKIYESYGTLLQTWLDVIW